MQYVPQRPSLLPGTPLELLTTARAFWSRSSNISYGDPIELAAEWGIDRILWAREWATLSGGEGQRLALAIALGLGGTEVVLLDGK